METNDNQPAKVYAFEVWINGRERFASIINAHTPGAARYDYFLDCRDSWPDLKITEMRSRKLGMPRPADPESFARVATYRSRHDLKCGTRVIACGESGVIVGSNASANFDVLFDSGHRGNVHPGDIIAVQGEAAE